MEILKVNPKRTTKEIEHNRTARQAPVCFGFISGTGYPFIYFEAFLRLP